MKETNIEIARKSYKMNYSVNGQDYNGIIQIGTDLKFSFRASNGIVTEHSPANLHGSFVLRLYQKIVLNEKQA